MPPHKDMLDDHAIASITTYIRRRFGKRASAAKTTEVTEIRNKDAKGKALTKK